MPITPNPIPRIALPFRHEGSSLRHLRDGDSIGREWQKAKKDNDALRAQGLALSRLQKQFDSLKRPKNQVDRWFPFKIYNVPPQFCANPADSWRTFRVRGGFVGWRSMYGNPSWDSSTYESFHYIDEGADGSSFVTDPHDGFQTSIIQTFVNGNFEVVNVPDTGTAGVTSTYPKNAEFVLNSSLDLVNQRWAEFWIEFVDSNTSEDPTLGVKVQIRCRMCEFSGGPAPRPGYLLPSPNQIPIGLVSIRKADDPPDLLGGTPNGYAIEQYIYDNQLNRYPLGYSHPSISDLYSSSGMIYRGEAWYSDHEGMNWSATGVGDSPLVNATFYPGDVVAYKDTIEVDSVTKERTGLYIYNWYPQNQVEPPTPGSTWTRIMRSEYTII